MRTAKTSFRISALFVGVSALFHLAAPLFGGASPEATTLFVSGVLYLGVAWGLLRGMRGLAYFAFLILMIDSVASLSRVWSDGPIPSWIYSGIFIADGLSILALFFALWRSAAKPAAR